MKIQVTPHTIQIIRDTDINAGEYNVSKCTFEFSNEYQELSNVAVFTNCEGTCVEQAITNNECIIPYEMLENPGQVKLGVYGYEVEEETLVLRYSPTAQYFNVKNGSYAEGEQPTPPSPSIVEQLQAQITDNRNDINDLQEDVGNIKEDITELQGDVSNLEQTKADKSEIPTKVSQLDNDSGYIDKNVDDLTNYTPTNELSAVATSGSYNDLEDKPDLSVYATTQSLNDEISNRQNADNNLQGQIDAITSSSDVKDIVGTYQDLLEYDTSTLGNDDIIKVLEDNTHNDAMTYYRWVISGSSGSWEYIGQEGPYYTKSQSNELLNEKVGFTDYATSSKGGVVIVNGYGLQIINGNLRGLGRTYEQYQSSSDNLVVAKSTLENVITGKELTNKTYVDNADNLKEDKSNKVTSIDENSTDTQYPSAKCVYDSQEEQDTIIEGLDNELDATKNELEATKEELNQYKTIYNVLPKVEGNGESITLDNTGESILKLDTRGQCKQDGEPTPDAPQQIHEVSGDNEIVVCGKNLLNRTTCEENKILTWTTGILWNDTGSLTSDYIEAKANETIKTNYYAYIFCFDSNKTYLGNINQRGELVTNAGTYWKSRTIPNNSNIAYIRLVYRPTGNEGINLLTANIMVNKGEILGNYEPYNGDTYELSLGDIKMRGIGTYEDYFIRNSGKNLFDKDTATTQVGYFDANGNIVSGGSSTITTSYTKIIPNIDMVFSGVTPEHICFYDENKNFIERVSNTTTFNKNAYYIRFQETTNSLNLDNIQLEVGTSATLYEPYGKGKWCKYNAIGEAVLTGNNQTEAWNKDVNIDTEYDYFYTSNFRNIAIINPNNFITDKFYKLRYIQDAEENGFYATSVFIINIAKSLTGIVSSDTTAQRNAKFRDWLSTHNTQVKYVLASPYLSLIESETLINQLDAIEKALGKDGQTNISQVNNDAPFKIYASALEKISNS